MANKTITTDATVEEIIASGLGNGQNITINAGAVATHNQTNTALTGQYNINDGELLITSPIVGNVNIFIGESGEEAHVNGQGKFTVDGDWYDLGTTDGTESQVIDLTTYWGSSDFVDSVPMVEVETGRRIDFDGEVGDAPEIDDWLYLTSDNKVMGRIVQVEPSYLVVKFLTGQFVDNDAIQVKKVVDDGGIDLQISWTALVNNALGDIKEAGVYQQFGNAYKGGSSYISDMHRGLGGFVFSNPFQSLDLTFATSAGVTGGFKPPTGCNIRIPDIHFTSTTVANFLLQDVTPNSISAQFNLSTTNAGEVSLSVCNLGQAAFPCLSAAKFIATDVGCHTELGSQKCGSRQVFTRVTICDNAPSTTASKYFGFAVIDCVLGADIVDCMRIMPTATRGYIGGETSIGVHLKNCIVSIADGAVQSGSSNYLYYINKVQGWSINNCVGIAASGSAGNSTIRGLSSPDGEVKTFHFGTQDYTEQTGEHTLISATNSCNDLYVENVAFIGGGMGNPLMQYGDSFRLKLRACGMIDDKLYFGTDGEQFVSLTGVGGQVDIARCWKSGGGNKTFISIPSTFVDVVLTNCSGDYASEIQPSGADQISFRGVHGAEGNMGGSTGIETDYPATYGSHMHTIMRSDTDAVINIIFSEKTDNTNGHYTVTAGDPKYFRNGDFSAVPLDQVIYETQEFVKGLTGLTGVFTTSRSTSNVSDGTDEWGASMDLELQYDDGTGYNGVWLDIKTPANLTSIVVPPSGIKFKVRITCVTARTLMNGFMLHASTTLAAQKDNFYLIDQLKAPINITVINEDGDPIDGAHVYLEELSGHVEIINGTTDSFGVITTEVDYVSDTVIKGWAREFDLLGTDRIPLDIEGSYTINGFSTTIKLRNQT